MLACHISAEGAFKYALYTLELVILDQANSFIEIHGGPIPVSPSRFIICNHCHIVEFEVPTG